MSAFTHFLRPLPATRRAYSVFSKTGGGRYFNSARPPKVVAQTASATKGKVDATSPTSNADATASGVAKEDSSASQPSGAPLVSDAQSSPAPAQQMAHPLPFLVHPPVNPQDLKLHQFFSIHRPLLNLSQPPSSIFDPPPIPFSESISASNEARFGDFDDPPEASPESDADAARQLARALVVNRVGMSMSWESALQRLGLDVTKGRAEELSLAQAEFDVYLDSTKRKRRKKMKKHKLKKRRRLSRSQRVKIGR